MVDPDNGIPSDLRDELRADAEKAERNGDRACATILRQIAAYAGPDGPGQARARALKGAARTAALPGGHRMRARWLCLALLALAPSPAVVAAQGLPRARPELVGMSTAQPNRDRDTPRARARDSDAVSR